MPPEREIAVCIIRATGKNNSYPDRENPGRAARFDTKARTLTNHRAPQLRRNEQKPGI
jgi:hypothetical protein